MNISKLCKKNYLCLMLAVIMIFSILPKAELLAEEKEDDYVNIIQKYYECINKSNIIDIHNLYGKELNDFVGNFFIETDNTENHKGIYNIKNVDILSVQKVGTDYDIDRIAQNYNPNTQISVNAANAVNYIQNYFMLGDYGENFKSFYYQKFNENSIIGKFAYENGGVLSHLDTEKLGKSGYTWQEILEYYYTKRSGIDYFPNAKQSDGIIITTGHIHDWSNALYCPYCGAEVY